MSAMQSTNTHTYTHIHEGQLHKTQGNVTQHTHVHHTMSAMQSTNRAISCSSPLPVMHAAMWHRHAMYCTGVIIHMCDLHSISGHTRHEIAQTRVLHRHDDFRCLICTGELSTLCNTHHNVAQTHAVLHRHETSKFASCAMFCYALTHIYMQSCMFMVTSVTIYKLYIGLCT
jgi:hypothetical protein